MIAAPVKIPRHHKELELHSRIRPTIELHQSKALRFAATGCGNHHPKDALVLVEQGDTGPLENFRADKNILCSILG